MFRLLNGLAVVAAMWATSVDALEQASPPATRWQSPPEDVLEVLHAPPLPWVWAAPSGQHLLLADPVTYPDLAELAAPMHKLAGMRVNPAINAIHGRHGATSPRLVEVEGGAETPLPADAEVQGVTWTADGRRFALIVRHADHMGLWVGSVEGGVRDRMEATSR